MKMLPLSFLNDCNSQLLIFNRKYIINHLNSSPSIKNLSNVTKTEFTAQVKFETRLLYMHDLKNGYLDKQIEPSNDVLLIERIGY